jgi:predicted ferric reductase
MAITTLYLMGWFTGLIKPFMAASASGLEADYQLHQIRFLLAFIMLAVGTVALNYDYWMRETLIVSTWVQFYFLVTGIARYARTMPEDSYQLLAAYAGNLVFIVFLLLILTVEEHRLQQRP